MLWHSAPSSWCWWASSDSASPPKKVATVALIWTLVLAFTYFNITGASFKENVAVYDALLWKGIKEDLKIVLMVFGAFVILNLLRDTGAINEVKGAIARISDDRRVQVVIVGMMLPIFLEGAAGAGSPAAIAAPFLVGLGFAIILGVYMVLTMLYTCVLFPHFGM